jgi:hypothetical protein
MGAIGGGTGLRVIAAVAIAGLPVLAGCGGATPQHGLGANGCAMTPAAQQLLGQLLDSVEEEVDTAVEKDSPTELALMWNFVATDNRVESNVSLATMCAGENTQEETCSTMLGAPPVIPDVDTCFRTACEMLNVLLVDVYATQAPHHLADDRVSMSYAATPPYPSGTVKYDPNPLTRWRLDFRLATVRSVAATLQQHVSIALSTGEKIDLSFSEQTSGTHTIADDTWTTNTALSFANLSPDGHVEVAVSNASNAPRSGTVTMGAEKLAIITQDGLVWRGACGAPHVAGRDAGSH